MKYHDTSLKSVRTHPYIPLDQPGPENPTWVKWPMEVGWIVTTNKKVNLLSPRWTMYPGKEGREVVIKGWCIYQDQVVVTGIVYTTRGILDVMILLHELGPNIDWETIQKP